MKKLLSGLGIAMLMVACNNGETKTSETDTKPADTLPAAKPAATDTVPSTVSNVVIPETPGAMAAELCRLNKGIKTAKAMGDMNMANVTQKKYDEYNAKLKEKFGKDELAKITIKSIMEKCDKN